jgi:hypothetical protein
MMRLALLLLFTIATAFSFAAPSDFWRPVEFHPTPADANIFTAHVDHYRLSLHDPDSPSKPALWDSELTVADDTTHKTCESESLLIARVYLLTGIGRILLLSVDGSLTQVDVVDAASCKTLQQIKAFTENVEVQGLDVQMLPACECAQADRPCSCSSGRVFRTGGDGKLVLNAKASDSLTLDKLGVSFRGDRKVLHPGTKQAQVK